MWSIVCEKYSPDAEEHNYDKFNNIKKMKVIDNRSRIKIFGHRYIVSLKAEVLGCVFGSLVMVGSFYLLYLAMWLMIK